MPYLQDPRGRVTLNFHADDFAALAADAARAGHASPGKYALALVQARGAALRPVVDAHGAQHVARLKAKLATAQRELAACQDARAADATGRRALERELAGRSSRAEFHQMLEDAVARHMAEEAAKRAAATPPAPEETARNARRAARRDPS